VGAKQVSLTQALLGQLVERQVSLTQALRGQLGKMPTKQFQKQDL
jgi:hypothetical protein